MTEKRTIVANETAHYKRVTIYLTEDERRKAMAWCALRGMKLASMGREAILTYIKELDIHYVIPETPLPSVPPEDPERN